MEGGTVSRSSARGGAGRVDGSGACQSGRSLLVVQDVSRPINEHEPMNASIASPDTQEWRRWLVGDPEMNIPVERSGGPHGLVLQDLLTFARGKLQYE